MEKSETRGQELPDRLEEIALFFVYSNLFAWIPWLIFVRGGKKGLLGGVFPLLLGVSIGQLQTDGTKQSLMARKLPLTWSALLCAGLYYLLVQRHLVLKLVGFLLLAGLGWTMPWLYWHSLLVFQLDKDERTGMPGDSLRAQLYARRVGLI
jgi:prepilin signal peptidase PulO-like enzyme (type II secretory pathway)